MTKPFLRVVSFPLTLCAGVIAGLAIVRAGAPGVVGLLVPIALLVVTLALLERLIPWEPRWRNARGDVPTDVAHLVASVLLSPLVQGVTIAALQPFGTTALGSMPLPLEIGLVVVLGDLGPYWYHRVSHEWSRFLFRVHAVHHAPTRLYWLNAFRVHPLNLAAGTALRLLPGILLGASHEAVFVAALLAAMVNVWAHANVDVRAGILDWLLSGPAVHRVHHHERPQISQSNYGATTVFWDVVFGTRRAPMPVRDGEVGVGEATPREGWLSQLLHPFGLTCCAGPRGAS